eukprot:TRINITY_DN317_c0_g1_i3.p1 TRINITY_DN317_c0_g1~~TRINITY_DN317_c0_g1_i3.p1  ORF type:complete len:870 (+),score=191.32 TRINITY_DN317_c0_g1_i3:97-2610(+)
MEVLKAVATREEAEEDEELVMNTVKVTMFALMGSCLTISLMNYTMPKSLRLWAVPVFVLGIAVAPSEIGVIKLINRLDPEIITLVFLPPILFISGLCVDWHAFSRLLVQSLLLAGPGVLLCAPMVGLVARYCFVNYQWNWTEALLLGAALSATDPVATIATVKKLGASPKLSVLIEGEALLNDGTAYVLFLVLKRVLVTNVVAPGDIVKTFLKLSAGGPAFGIALAMATYMWLRTIHRKPVLEIAVLIIGVYSTMFISEPLGISGVLAVVCFGLYVGYRGKYGISPCAVESNVIFWEQLEFIINSLLFFFSGVIVYNQLNHNNGEDWINLAILFFTLQISRALTLLLMWPALHFTGYGFNWKKYLMLWSAGLRGGVSLSLALFVANDSSGVFEPTYQGQFVTMVVGSVLLTSVINGLMAKPLYQMLKFDPPSDQAVQLYEHAVHEAEKEVEAYIHSLQDDFTLESVNWEVAMRVVSTYVEGESKLRFYTPYWLSFWKKNLEGLLPAAAPDVHRRNSEQMARQPNSEEGSTQEIHLLARKMIVNFVKEEVQKQYEGFAQLTPQGIISAVEIVDDAAEEPTHFFERTLVSLSQKMHQTVYLPFLLRVPLVKIVYVYYKFIFLHNAIELCRCVYIAYENAVHTVEEHSHLKFDTQLGCLKAYIKRQLGLLQAEYPCLYALAANTIAAKLVLNFKKDKMDELLHDGFIDMRTRDRLVRTLNRVIRGAHNTTHRATRSRRRSYAPCDYPLEASRPRVRTQAWRDSPRRLRANRGGRRQLGLHCGCDKAARARWRRGRRRDGPAAPRRKPCAAAHRRCLRYRSRHADHRVAHHRAGAGDGCRA